jgi:prevent-host-death family protein
MDAIGIFEAKTRFSEICEKVFNSREPVLITKRGVPIVKILPVTFNENQKSDIWEVREGYLQKYGEPDKDIEIPKREAETLYTPFEE